MPGQKKQYLDKIILSSNHNIIKGHIPEKMDLDIYYDKILEETVPQDSDSFGLFDVSSPDFNTFFPDVTQKDLQPSDDEMIFPLFRALSAGIVNKKFFPTDFGKRGVLKKSMKLLQGQTVFPNHESNIGNQLGVVTEVSFQGKSKARNGLEIPPGINVKLMIDGKSHPNVARGINMRPPSIHSTSVTVGFAWEPSHKFDEIRDFFDKIGQFDDKGELIRRIVTEIKFYNEISFVPHGADAFAKQIVDGEIALPDHTGAITSLAYQDKEKPQVYLIDYKTDIDSLSLSSATPDALNNNDANEDTSKQNNTMKEFLLKLAKSLNIELSEGQEPTEEEITTALAAAVKIGEDKTAAEVALRKEIDEIHTPALTKLQGEYNQLKKDSEGVEKLEEGQTIEGLQASAKIAAATLEVDRADAIGAYKKLKGDKADNTIIELMQKADHVAVAAYNKQYVEELEEKFPGTCTDCGSHNVSRVSAQEGDDSFDAEEKKDKNGKTKPTNKSNADVVASLREDNAAQGNHLHGDEDKSAE